MRQPRPFRFIDEPDSQAALSRAADATIEAMLDILPDDRALQQAIKRQLANQLTTLLTGQHAGPALPPLLPCLLGDDAFGDRFEIADLPLPRPAHGYAVQQMASDRLLDRHSLRFLPVRHAQLDALHPSFDSAYASARKWLQSHPQEPANRPLIVPAAYDAALKRHVLIYGVLTDPKPEQT